MSWCDNLPWRDTILLAFYCTKQNLACAAARRTALPYRWREEFVGKPNHDCLQCLAQDTMMHHNSLLVDLLPPWCSCYSTWLTMMSHVFDLNCFIERKVVSPASCKILNSQVLSWVRIMVPGTRLVSPSLQLLAIPVLQYWKVVMLDYTPKKWFFVYRR